MGIKSIKEWYNCCKQNKIPINIPKTPNMYYNDEWVSWNDWLGHNNTTHKNYISYSKAKEYLSNIGISSLQEYYDYVITNQIDFLPLLPISYYKNDYISSDDFLGYSKKISYGEKKIIDYFSNKNIKYIHQHKFDDCKNINNLIFDFFIEDKNICIEFDGRQHYEPISFFGGEDGYNKRIENDSIKNEYCLYKKIKLVRISYEDINIINMILDKEIHH